MTTPLLLRNAWAILAACLIVHSASATTYYVNSATGSDANAGTSSATAWQTLDRVNNGPSGPDANGNPSSYQPGDGIRLARGSVWNGACLYPRGSGTAASPITIDSYGTGATPVINAAGAYPKYQQVPRTESAAVWLYNQKYIEVRNLELTNHVTSVAQFDDPTVTQDDYRWGILVEAENGSGGDLVSGSTTYEFPHIVLAKNIIHHVEGYDSAWDASGATQKQVSTGGINVNVRRVTSSTQAPLADTYVQDGANAGNNFGTAATLNVKAGATGYNREALLQFALPATTNAVTSAVLRVYGNNTEDATSVPITAYDVPNSWTETGVTWTTQPAVGSARGSVSVTNTLQYYEIDVTSYIQQQMSGGATTVSFLLSTTLSKLVAFNSREAGTKPPQLVVTSPDLNPTRFRDVQIEENSIYEVNSCGIATRSLWNDRTTDQLWPDVIVRHNVIDHPGGSGMIIRNTTGALVDGNIVSYANTRSGQAGVGMYAFNANNTVFQYNEAYGTFTLSHDGQGFDIDYQQSGTIFQYNYSHDNTGGFIESTGNGQYGYTSVNSIARYNLSQNDGTRIFRFSGGSSGIQIYNNTVYVGTGFTGNIVSIFNWGGLYPVNAHLANNIIYNVSSDTGVGYDFGPATGTAGTGRIDGFVFDSCVFYNTVRTPTNEPVAGDIRYTVTNKITADPQLVSPGSGGTGFETVNGYKLASTSTVIGAGALITTTDSTMMPLPTQDFWGNPVSASVAPSVGAYDGQGVSAASTLYFVPAADTFSRDGGSASSNFGTLAYLQAKGDDAAGYNRRSYLRFDLSSLAAGSVTSAKLRVYCNSTQDGSAVATTVYATTDAWGETTLNWTNQPALGTAVATGSVTTANRYYDYDVTGFVQQETATGGDRAVSLVLTAAGAKLLQFNSREATANPPQLIVAATVNGAAAADAYIRGGTYAGSNFGTATTLAVKDDATDDFTRKSYVRFTLPSGLVGVNSAQLRLYGNSSGKSVRVQVTRVADNTWLESGAGAITWSNAPAGTIPVTVAAVGGTAGYVQFDVTDFVQNALASGAGAVTLLVGATDDSQDLVQFNSREATANPPQLVLQ